MKAHLSLPSAQGRRPVRAALVTWFACAALLVPHPPPADPAEYQGPGGGAPVPCHCANLAAVISSMGRWWVPAEGYYRYSWDWQYAFACPPGGDGTCSDCLYAQVEYLGADGVTWTPAPSSYLMFTPASGDCGGNYVGDGWYSFGQVACAPADWNPSCVPNTSERLALYGRCAPPIGGVPPPGGSPNCSDLSTYSLLDQRPFLFPSNP
jgi:hypothetical protein